jgi:mannose-1-phosphate guanylyltransferase
VPGTCISNEGQGEERLFAINRVSRAKKFLAPGKMGSPGGRKRAFRPHTFGWRLKGKMFDHYYAVIMAGGGGTRLWPLSRQSRPKQMLSLFDERSLFQTAVNRLGGLFPAERILVVTVQDQAAALQEQVPAIPAENYLIEPMPRGTASVVGLAAVALLQRDPQAVMSVLTSDHYMKDEERFRQVLRVAYQAAQDGYLVTLGVEPTFAATGYGYIQQGEKIGDYHEMEAFRVLRFEEKPDGKTAARFLQSGDHVWNSGMFIWRVERIMAEFDRQMPELAAGLQSIAGAWQTPEEESVIRAIWSQLKAETIDYGIMENAQNVAVVPAAGIGWSDVGSWDSLFDLLDGDENGNIIIGAKHLGLDTQDTLAYVEGPKRFIVTIGVQDLVVVDTGDVLLICSKDQAQRVRQVVNLLKNNGGTYV